MVDGPYIIWQSEDKYSEVFFELQQNNWVEKKIDKNVGEFPEAKVDLGGKTISVPLQKKFSPQTSNFQQINKIIAFGDIHGEYDQLVKMLMANQVIDEQLNWIYGEGHLVFCGDIFDRGSQVTECLWLIYYLEQKALQQGGYVHYLLGNHEVMSLTGDHRYLHKKYKKIAASMELEYQDLFNQTSELGRWLRKKNMVITLDNKLFVHAGLSPVTSEQIGELNQILQEYLAGNQQYFYFVNDPSSPLWYRGYLYSWQGASKVSQDEMEDILEKYAADKIIFAHTEVDKITAMFQQLAIAIDVSFKLFPQALLIQDEEYYMIDDLGQKEKLF